MQRWLRRRIGQDELALDAAVSRGSTSLDALAAMMDWAELDRPVPGISSAAKGGEDPRSRPVRCSQTVSEQCSAGMGQGGQRPPLAQPRRARRSPARRAALRGVPQR
jgi:hypothetical protein